MIYFIVVETFPAAAKRMGDGTYSAVGEVVTIRGLIEAKDLHDAETQLRLGPRAKDGSYRLVGGSSIRLRRIERLQWLAHPGSAE